MESSHSTASAKPSAVFSYKLSNRLRQWPVAVARQDNALMATLGLRRLLIEDLKRNMWDWTLPGFRAIAVYRFGVWSRTLRFLPFRLVCLLLHTFLFRTIRNRYGIELYASARIGRRFLIGHQSGIVIHRFAAFGDDCLIRQNVTLGEAGMGRDNFSAGIGPVIGDHVDIGAGAVIIGNVRIGDHVRIGPNAVVMTDVPAHATVMAPMSRSMVRPTVETTPNTHIQQGHANDADA